MNYLTRIIEVFTPPASTDAAPKVVPIRPGTPVPQQVPGNCYIVEYRDVTAPQGEWHRDLAFGVPEEAVMRAKGITLNAFVPGKADAHRTIWASW